ncbi:WXG100 family type VII secretion target [Bombilactobacillus thymidiniphilus]|uniref:ESAT-6-like protein n=1 Tax=Bombilactobacillus thymidiniphilus TaxID=2923363 RepID=A0ABY4PFG6_9LACO|nr:WXG100 family type VII secretion target [Bombilactobacillus thymidiniphilus]UQS84307.1 WXG100 family type VII secretion target [Bombilactobacillus thymidiniphilus]
MAGQIAVTPDELRQQATHYTKGADNVDSTLSDLKNMQEQIRSEWKGNAFEKYDQKFQELSGKVTEFSQLLREIKGQLDKSAQAMQDADNQIGQSWN